VSFFGAGVEITGFSTSRNLRRLSSYAKEFDETEIEIEDSSRRQKAFQNHRERQNQTHALRQTPLDGHQSSRPDAQAKKADTGQSQGRSRRQTNASLRLEISP
jgi:hypothetical protein